MSIGRETLIAAIGWAVLVMPRAHASSEPLDPEAVLASAERHHPRVLAALSREDVAAAELRAARGNFDPQLSARGSARTGFYELRRLDAELRQPTTFWGAEIYTGYRLGLGGDSNERYPSYYDDQTLDRGEVRAGIWVPLWRDGPLDPRRAETRRALHRLEAATESREGILLELSRHALEAYFAWVAAGRRLEVSEQVLGLAVARLEQVRARAADGAIPPVDAIEAEHAVLLRREMRLRAERALEASALRLGLFSRDDSGAPAPPSPNALPRDLRLPPPIDDPRALRERSLECHPRLAAARASLRALEVDRDLARAQRGPRLDLGIEVSRDFGDGPESLRGTVFESRALFSMPLLMRTPRARLNAAEERLFAEREDLRFLEDSLRLEIDDTLSRWSYARERFDVSRARLSVTRRLADAERARFEAGASDLLFVNLREQSMAEAEVALVDAVAELWYARVHWDALTRCGQR